MSFLFQSVQEAFCVLTKVHNKGHNEQIYDSESGMWYSQQSPERKVFKFEPLRKSASSEALCPMCKLETGHRNVCPVCSKCNRSAADLKRHHRTHTGERPFACNVCGRKFKCTGTLFTHQKGVHHIKRQKDLRQERLRKEKDQFEEKDLV